MSLSNAQRRRKMEEARRKRKPQPTAPIVRHTQQSGSTPAALDAKKARSSRYKQELTGKITIYGNDANKSFAARSASKSGDSIDLVGRKNNPEPTKGRSVDQRRLDSAIAKDNLGRSLKGARGEVSGSTLSKGRGRMFESKSGGAFQSDKSGNVRSTRTGKTTWQRPDGKTVEFDPKTLKQPLKQLARETVVRGVSKLVGGKFGAAVDLANRADQAITGLTGKSAGKEYRKNKEEDKKTVDRALEYAKRQLRIKRS